MVEAARPICAVPFSTSTFTRLGLAGSGVALAADVAFFDFVTCSLLSNLTASKSRCACGWAQSTRLFGSVGSGTTGTEIMLTELARSPCMLSAILSRVPESRPLSVVTDRVAGVAKHVTRGDLFRQGRHEVLLALYPLQVRALPDVAFANECQGLRPVHVVNPRGEVELGCRIVDRLRQADVNAADGVHHRLEAAEVDFDEVVDADTGERLDRLPRARGPARVEGFVEHLKLLARQLTMVPHAIGLTAQRLHHGVPRETDQRGPGALRRDMHQDHSVGAGAPDAPAELLVRPRPAIGPDEQDVQRGVVFGRALSEQSFDVLFLDVPQQVAPLGVGDKRRAHHSRGHYDRDPPQNPQPPRPAAARTAWRVALWRPFRPCCTAVRYAPRAVVENVVACHRLPRESPVVPSVRPPGR